jgi:hypothetical protein
VDLNLWSSRLQSLQYDRQRRWQRKLRDWWHLVLTLWGPSKQSSHLSTMSQLELQAGTVLNSI